MYKYEQTYEGIDGRVLCLWVMETNQVLLMKFHRQE